LRNAEELQKADGAGQEGDQKQAGGALLGENKPV
jgi:hypothetical protein